MEPVCTNAHSATSMRQGAGDHQWLCGISGVSQVCCVPAPGHQLHSSGSKLPSQLDFYNPHHLLEERTGTPLTTRRGHLEASPRAILESACDIHCFFQHQSPLRRPWEDSTLTTASDLSTSGVFSRFLKITFFRSLKHDSQQLKYLQLSLMT